VTEYTSAKYIEVARLNPRPAISLEYRYSYTSDIIAAACCFAAGMGLLITAWVWL
jgi:hypothetical protein